MKRELVSAAGQTVPAIACDIWLWLANHELAWFVSLLTIIYICSQLWWGWRKYLKEQKE